MSITYLVVENLYEDFELVDGCHPIYAFPNIITAQHYCDELNINAIIQLVEENMLYHFIGTSFDKKLADTLAKIGYKLEHHSNGIHWYMDSLQQPIEINKEQAIELLSNLNIRWYEVIMLKNDLSPIYKHHLSR